MSVKDKGKDNNNESVTVNRIIPVITVFYAIEQAEQMIKVKKSKPFSDNRETFSEYIIFVRLFI
jgi:hypothetical protein